MQRLWTTPRLALRTGIARAGTLLLFAGLAGLAASVTSACQQTYTESPCKNVPPAGCPLSHGHACDDPTCEAAYACNPDGTWELDHPCPGVDASASPATDATSDGSDATSDASVGPVPRDASIDVPPGANGGPDCAPLELPDCTLGFALACPQGCCGCEDLYVCDAGGWTAWGACDADAGIAQTN